MLKFVLYWLFLLFSLSSTQQLYAIKQHVVLGTYDTSLNTVDLDNGNVVKLREIQLFSTSFFPSVNAIAANPNFSSPVYGIFCGFQKQDMAEVRGLGLTDVAFTIYGVPLGSYANLVFEPAIQLLIGNTASGTLATIDPNTGDSQKFSQLVSTTIVCLSLDTNKHNLYVVTSANSMQQIYIISTLTGRIVKSSNIPSSVQILGMAYDNTNTRMVGVANFQSSGIQIAEIFTNGTVSSIGPSLSATFKGRYLVGPTVDFTSNSLIFVGYLNDLPIDYLFTVDLDTGSETYVELNYFDGGNLVSVLYSNNL